MGYDDFELQFWKRDKFKGEFRKLSRESREGPKFSEDVSFVQNGPFRHGSKTLTLRE